MPFSKKKIASFLAATCFSSLFFSSSVAAYSGDDYLKSISQEKFVISSELTDDQKDQLMDDLSWIHFSMTNALPRKASADQLAIFAKSQDAQSIIESSDFTKYAWQRISQNDTLNDLLIKLEGDGILSIEDALIFSRSAAKALDPSLNL